MHNHAHVRHPKELIQEAKNRTRRDNRLLYYNDIVLEWITNHVLASVILFDIALIVPLLTLNAPDTVSGHHRGRRLRRTLCGARLSWRSRQRYAHRQTQLPPLPSHALPGGDRPVICRPNFRAAAIDPEPTGQCRGADGRSQRRRYGEAPGSSETAFNLLRLPRPRHRHSIQLLRTR